LNFRRLFFTLPALLFAALAVFFFVQLKGGGDPARIPSTLIGRSAPATVLAPLEGFASAKEVSTDMFAQGRVSILNVWASWCGPCRAEHPLLMELATRYKDNPRVQIVGLNYKDAPENARRFLGTLGNPYTHIGVDPKGRAGIEWGVYGVPETFVIDGQGTIRAKTIGPLGVESAKQLHADIEKLLENVPR
jgi:cytochrome c biogenesis protein CcmG, thiol:disulfide interchange protein DsbE